MAEVMIRQCRRFKKVPKIRQLARQRKLLLLKIKVTRKPKRVLAWEEKARKIKRANLNPTKNLNIVI